MISVSLIGVGVKLKASSLKNLSRKMVPNFSRGIAPMFFAMIFFHNSKIWATLLSSRHAITHRLKFVKKI